MADLSYCDECGGIDGCLYTCKWMAPIIAGRAKKAADKRDLELLRKIRGHPMRDGAVRAMRTGIRSVEQDIRFDPACDRGKASGLVDVWNDVIALLSPSAEKGGGEHG